MSTYRLTPAARRDLSRIWDYSEERWGLQQAEVYLRDLQTCLERLADDPRRGHPRDEVRPGYRSRAVGSHVVLTRDSLVGFRWLGVSFRWYCGVGGLVVGH